MAQTMNDQKGSATETLASGTDKTPQVTFDHESGLLSIEGAFDFGNMLDSQAFCEPILRRLEDLLFTNGIKTISILLDGVTPALKPLVDDIFFLVVGEKDVEVIWGYYKGDDEMNRTGAEYDQAWSKIHFTFVKHRRKKG